jgi:hypothetical protein
MEIIYILISLFVGVCLAIYTYLILGLNGVVKGCDSEAAWMIPFMSIGYASVFYFFVFFVSYSMEVC